MTSLCHARNELHFFPLSGDGMRRLLHILASCSIGAMNIAELVYIDIQYQAVERRK